MKPKFQINHRSKARDTFATRRTGSTTPKIEQSFQSTPPEFFGHRPGDRRSFRSISQDYFTREARGHFKSEALFFGLIVLTAAVPMIEGIRGLAQFVYGIL
ncbi:MAG: hypothetical protein ABIR71_00975 [Chthoniobacterales bacterium]